MTYANYVNATYAASGANNNTYTNYADKYKNTGYNDSSSPYGYYIGTAGTVSYSNYTNYNNWMRSAPAAYTMTTSRSAFNAGQSLSGTPIGTLRNDANQIAVDHVASTGAGITSAQTPAYTVNTSANLASGAATARGIINEFITNVASLWATITGNTSSSLPAAKASGDLLSGADFQTIYDRLNTLGAAQAATAITGTPPNTTPAPGTARTTGYLNCAHWANTAGTGNPNIPFASAGTQTAGSVSYPNIGTEPATNR